MNLVFETSRPFNDLQVNRDQKLTKLTATTSATSTMVPTSTANSTTAVSAATTSKTKMTPSNNKTKNQSDDSSGLSIFKRKRKFQKDQIHTDIQENASSINILSSPSNKENISLNQNYSNANGNNNSSDKISSSPLSSAIQSTKLAIINSFSQFQIFSSQLNDNCSNSIENISSVELKNYRLSIKKWTHLCFAIDLIINTKTIQITIIIDGSDQFKINLPLNFNQNNIQQMIKNEQFQIICLGQNKIKKSFSSCSTSYINSNDNDEITSVSSNNSTEKYKYLEYSLSTLMIFKKCFNRKSILANLTALGPDCTNLAYCQVSKYFNENFNKFYVIF